MKTFLSFLICSMFVFGKAHSQSIRFQPLSWPEALAKAKKENKPLFIEMYTSWCTYCRKMEQTVFSTPEAGGFYNNNFINVRYDALKADGIQIRKSYALLGFPTFLYLDANGMVLKKTAGYQNTEAFIGNGNAAISSLQNK